MKVFSQKFWSMVFRKPAGFWAPAIQLWLFGSQQMLCHPSQALLRSPVQGRCPALRKIEMMLRGHNRVGEKMQQLSADTEAPPAHTQRDHNVQFCDTWKRKGRKSLPQWEVQGPVCLMVILLGGESMETAKCGLEPLFHGQIPFGLANITLSFLLFTCFFVLKF